jgi:hypothetical protein
MFDTEHNIELCSLANTGHYADRTIGAFLQACGRRMNPHKVFEVLAAVMALAAIAWCRAAPKPVAKPGLVPYASGEADASDSCRITHRNLLGALKRGLCNCQSSQMPGPMPPIVASLGGRVYPVVGPPPNCTRTCESIRLPSSPAIESARCFRNLRA